MPSKESYSASHVGPICHSSFRCSRETPIINNTRQNNSREDTNGTETADHVWDGHVIRGGSHGTLIQHHTKKKEQKEGVPHSSAGRNQRLRPVHAGATVVATREFATTCRREQPGPHYDTIPRHNKKPGTKYHTSGNSRATK